MPKSGIVRARKKLRYRKSLSHIPRANASEISSRGIALTDADLANVIGGSKETSYASAQTEVGAAQRLAWLHRFDFQQANH